MKNIPVIRFIVLFALFVAACNTTAKKPAKAVDDGRVSRIEVSIGGMSCTACEQTIQTSVSKLDGIKSVKASYTVGKAIVDYSPSLVDTSNIRKAITDVGYKVIGFASLLQSDQVK